MSEASTPSNDIKQKISDISIEELLSRFPNQEKGILSDLGPLERLVDNSDKIVRLLEDIKTILDRQSLGSP